ncbi:hypothetical protein [Euzebya tangerina]|uniref:hypothetical protein n=1 Tax=Euzebya tangerina TaxID=591198 RepID=UPI0013C2AB78|nr:hypothetical protein [Euzebya tangerina]
MAVELRPEWCASAVSAPGGAVISGWQVTAPVAKPLEEFDGDDCAPGADIMLMREAVLDERALRREMGLSAAARFGFTARWYCQKANLAGVHDGGPNPVLVLEDLTITLPGAVAGSVELETCVVLTAAAQSDPPVGSVIWSDAWSDRHDLGGRVLVIEGDEFRVPVVLTNFDRSLPPECRAGLWHIDIDIEAEMQDRAANNITIQLNARLIDQRFDGQVGKVPSALLQAMRIDMLRQVAARFLPEPEPQDFDDDTFAALALGIAAGTGGSWSSSARQMLEQPAVFETALWSIFSDGAW